jgi:hypothetical protein
MMVPDQLAATINALRGVRPPRSLDNNVLPPEITFPSDTWNTPVVPPSSVIGRMPAYNPRGL